MIEQRFLFRLSITASPLPRYKHLFSDSFFEIWLPLSLDTCSYRVPAAFSLTSGPSSGFRSPDEVWFLYNLWSLWERLVLFSLQVGGRVGLAYGSVAVLKAASTIAIRYSSVRQQFGPPGEPEIAILVSSSLFGCVFLCIHFSLSCRSSKNKQTTNPVT